MYKKDELEPQRQEYQQLVTTFSGGGTFNYLSCCGDLPELFSRSTGIYKSCHRMYGAGIGAGIQNFGFF